MNFIGLLFDIATSQRTPNSLAVISFNYDIGLDYALSYTKTPYEYFPDINKKSRKIPFLKLHGSLNWTKCPECGKIVHYPLEKIINFYPTGSDVGQTQLRVSTFLNQFHGHEHSFDPTPFIVPPTWNKIEYHRSISTIWKAAAQELSEARNIFICGYSLPTTDYFFHHLLALSLISGEIIDRFVVIDPESHVADRFKQTLGQPVLNVFASSNTSFEEIDKTVGDILNVPPNKQWNERWIGL
jgi:hypothetical protein